MLKVHILTPEQKLFEGSAESVTLPGVGGKFQVLNNHAPIVAALERGEVVVGTGKEKKSFAIQSGFIEVLKNNVNVLVQSAE